ncbi:sulfatase-like hydrolase/transferase [Carboxylicivirga sp. A043]|uniref:sulfatase family protein n=1 Tax=Carboxylicivirga litoralis TaxID=2816963 RepID=UPI0021CB5542|nr:sulfatase-like hydrolase/transferase [Carboxylicivirga sp. A043]MCU4157876.1 sulfatase-like hydrolase/transferase [Carboxylicivirga sp. A043]
MINTVVIKILLILALIKIGVNTNAQVYAKIEKQYQKVYGTPEKDSINPSELNFLLITSDQHHWMAMGYNNPDVQTPNLERLAKRGVVFDRAYCPNPTCTPTRASIITGMMPSQHGAYVLGTKLPEEVITIGDELSNAGYQTALIGKAHFQPFEGTAEFPSLEAYPILQELDFWRNFSGPFYGFNHIELARNHGDEPHVGQHYVIWMEEKLKSEGKAPNSWKNWFRKPTGTSEAQYGLWNLPEEYHMNTWIAERTNQLLEDCTRKKKPFFMWASFFDPHPPYLVSGKWADMYDPIQMKVPEIKEGEMDDMPPVYKKTQEQHPDFSEFKDSKLWSAGLGSHITRTNKEKAKDMALYYGMISFMDQEIGKILDKLDELGLTEKTIVLFTTDHGHVYGQHGLIKKGPFMYEDLVKVPMIVACPGTIPQGERSPSLQSLIDIAPTFLSLAGLDAPRCMTGVDQKTVWKGDVESLRNNVLVENHQQPYSLYQKQLITERYKLTTYMNHSYGELFDLKNDPGELNNLWDNLDYLQLKLDLLIQLIQAEMKQETIKVDRTAAA